MKVEFHGIDDPNGPTGIFLTAENPAEQKLLANLQLAVGNTPPIFSCLSDIVVSGERILNAVLDIFPGGK